MKYISITDRNPCQYSVWLKMNQNYNFQDTQPLMFCSFDNAETQTVTAVFSV